MRSPAMMPHPTWLSGLALCSAIVLGGCLPELDDPPLTATGEAPDDWKYTLSGPPKASSDQQPTAPSTCSGEYAGTLQDPAIDLSPSPCVVKGGIDLAYAPSAKLKALLSQITSVQGKVRINGDIALESVLPKLAEVSVLEYQGGGAGKTLKLPTTLKKVDNFYVFNTQFMSLNADVKMPYIASIEVSQNPKLISAYLFSDVQAFGNLNVSVNPMLVNIGIASRATTAGGIDLHDNIQLKSVTYWDDLTKLDADLQVQNCPSLDNLALLPKLQAARSLILSKVGGKLVDFNNLSQLQNLNVQGLEQQTNVFTVLPKVQVTQSVQLCMPAVSCALREAWLKQHAAGLTPLKCQFVEMCSNHVAP